MISLIRGHLLRLTKTAVFWGLSTTLIRLLGFVLVLPLVLRHLSSDHLAVWYLMQTMGSLALGIEVGFAPTLGRQASFFLAGAKEVHAIGYSGVKPDSPHANLPGLAGLVGTARKLYRYFAMIVFILVTFGGGGWLYLKFPQLIGQNEVWVSYLLYSLGLGLMMAGYFWADLLYGVNRVKEYHRNQIWGMVANYLCSFILLWKGFGLFAVAAGQILFSLIPRWQSRRQFLKEFSIDQIEKPQSVPWQHLWPMAWRSGLGVLASFFLLRFLTLVSAQVIDLEGTASLGLALQFCFLLHSVAQIWMGVKYPTISVWRVQGRWQDLRILVRKRVLMSLGTYAFGAVSIWFLGPVILQLIGSRTALLSPVDFGLLLILAGLDLWVGLHASILQTGNRVPYLKPFIVAAILVVPLAWWMGSVWGMTGLILAPALVQMGWNYWRIPQECWSSLKEPASGTVRAS